MGIPSHEARYLSEAEFHRLINGTDTLEWRSIPAKYNDVLDFSDQDICSPDQYLRIVALMYDQLDANKIPIPVPGDPFPLSTFEITYSSLLGLASTLPLWLERFEQRGLCQEQLSEGLCTHWPDIRKWVRFLYEQIIVPDDFAAIELRNFFKGVILEFFGLLCFQNLQRWSKSIPADREVMEMICNMWFVESFDPRFCSRGLFTAENQRESSIFHACLIIAIRDGGSIDCMDLLDMFEGSPKLLALVSLRHLEGEITHGNELDLRCITWDLRIIFMLALHQDIRRELLQCGMIAAASDILALVVGREWEGKMRARASECMLNAIRILRMRIESLDALPFLSQALDRELVASLLKCQTLLASSDQPEANHELGSLLGNILPAYSVHRSILCQLALAVDPAMEDKLDARLEESAVLHRAWSILKVAVNERRGLLQCDMPTGHVRTCQNDICSKTTHIRRLKRCAGCLHACYCSPECQRYDWRNGKHKQYCTRIQQRFVRTHGQMSAVHSKDLKFFDQVILAELRKYRERLGACPLITLVEMNFDGGQVEVAEVTLSSQGEIAHPFGIKCACESYSSARWKRMAEGMVRDEKRPMVLVRAFLPGGMSRKIVLQAIPLNVVMQDPAQGWRRSQRQVKDEYPFNLIFTCCGNASD